MEPRNLLDYLMLIPDPRVDRARRHELADIVVIALAAVLCDAEGWTKVGEFGKAGQPWLASFREPPSGIPSHDTFGRVFAALAPDALVAALQAFVRDFAGESAGCRVAVDGKTVRRSFDRAAQRGAIHMVSVWACERGVCFGQVKADDRSNEITAIPQLLERLILRGATVTIDAMGCLRAIAHQIVEGGGSYVLALKGNQGALHDEAAELIRRHWSVENELHWVLDVVFNEDQCRVRSQNAAENLSRLRRFALSPLRLDARAKVGTKGRRFRAAWDRGNLLHILGV